MDIIQAIREKSKRDPKRIVLPEGEDPRIREAAQYLEKHKIARPIVLTPKSLDSNKIARYAQIFYQQRQSKLTGFKEAKEIVSHPVFYAAMMVRLGEAEGFVAGAVNTTALVARASIQCLEADKDAGFICSSFFMIVPNAFYGENGLLVFADCGIIPLPTSEQLAKIAILSGELLEKVMGVKPRVAFLSYSTKGSAEGISVKKVKEAVEIAKKSKPSLDMDGELQADSAIVPQVAEIKCKDSPLKGRANVLIFPNLDAGNICYKLTERLCGARALGPLIMGANKPCSDLSRGCSVDDIIDCTAITSIRSQE